MCVFGVEGVRGEEKDRSTMIFRIISKSTGLALSMNIRVVPVIQGWLVQL